MQKQRENIRVEKNPMTITTKTSHTKEESQQEMGKICMMKNF